MVEADITLIAVVVGIFVPIIGLFIEHFHYNSQTQERLARLETKVDLFWSALGQQLAPMLLRGNPIPRDSPLAVLLQKYHTCCSVSPTCDCTDMGKNDRETLINLLDKEIIEGEHGVEDKLIMVLLQAVLKANL